MRYCSITESAPLLDEDEDFTAVMWTTQVRTEVGVLPNTHTHLSLFSSMPSDSQKLVKLPLSDSTSM